MNLRDTGVMLKVLIVDDDKSLVDALSEHLINEGYEIEVAYDGQEALDKIAMSPPNIVLLDILMPKLGGMETLKILKSKPETAKIPVIILSNVDDSDKVSEATQSGSVLYFVKSRSPLSLISTYIRDLLALN